MHVAGGDEPPPPPRPAVHDVLDTLVGALVRSCLGRPRADDAELCRALLPVINVPELPLDVRGAVAGAVCVALGTAVPDEEAELLLTTRDAALRLCREGGDELRVLLGAATLGLLAPVGEAGEAAADLITATRAARSVEQYELSLLLARRGLEQDGLDVRQRVFLLLTVGNLADDRDAVAEADRLLADLPDDDPMRDLAESLVGLRSDRPKPAVLSSAGEAVERNDRPAAAHDLIKVFADLRAASGADDELIGGMEATMEAFSAPDIDLDGARAGLTRVIGHWRARQILGEPPPAARAGIEMVMDLLSLQSSSDEMILLCELIEALADAGLSTLDALTSHAAVPEAFAAAVTHSTLAYRASVDPRWPDLGTLIGGLGTTDALLLRMQRRMTDGRQTIIAVHLRPPAGVAYKRALLSDTGLATLETLSTQSARAVEGVSRSAVNRLVAEIMPRSLTGTEHPAPPSLTVLPDGPLWSVPWGDAAVAGSPRAPLPITVSPSMTLHNRLPTGLPPIRTVFAIVDDTIPGARPLVQALGDASPALRVEQLAGLNELPPAPGREDMLLVYAHGEGEGLSYRLHLPGGTVTGLDLAALPLPPRAILAACWSGTAPPRTFPLSLPAALLLGGVSTVVAGLWPLPSRPTGTILSLLVKEITGGGPLTSALRTAVAQAGFAHVVDSSGLTVFGREDAPANEASLDPRPLHEKH